MPSITLIPGKEKRVFSGHPWIFRSDILSEKDHPAPGSIVDVFRDARLWMGIRDVIEKINDNAAVG